MKHKFRNIIICLVICLIVTGCHQKLTKKDMTISCNSSTVLLLKTRNTIRSQLRENSHKKLSITSKQLKQLKCIEKKLNVEKHKIQPLATSVANYPKKILLYQTLFAEYIRQIKEKQEIIKINKQFHKVVLEAQDININYQNGRTNKYLDKAVIADRVAQEKLKKVTKNTTHTKKKQSFAIPIKKVNVYKKHMINIPLGWGISFVVISILIITVIFLQPNKSNDSMSALTTTGGAELYNLPKARGYQLFLLRSTKVLIILLIVLLALFK